jgi:hypothetical protein
MKFVDPTKPYRKSGGDGAPQIGCTLPLRDIPALNCSDPWCEFQATKETLLAHCSL